MLEGLSARLSTLESEVLSIKSRNLRVEADKSWEVSVARTILIAVLTYIVIFLLFISLGSESPFSGSIVPTIGFMLSRLSLPVAKKIWLKKLGARTSSSAFME